jgi:hypothetical protein
MGVVMESEKTKVAGIQDGNLAKAWACLRGIL